MAAEIELGKIVTPKKRIDEIMDKWGVRACFDCGKCTSSCSMASINPDFSPRRIIEGTVLGLIEDIYSHESLWQCSGCYVCISRCPNEVYFPEFIREVRDEAVKRGHPMMQAHKNIFAAMSKLMVQEGSKPDLLAGWDISRFKTSEKSEVLFYPGCLAYLNIYFKRDLGINPIEAADNSLKILNKLGIEPMIPEGIVCCGHDSLWGGDIDTFKKLSKKNAEIIKKTGVKLLITPCPECYRTFIKDYPKMKIKIQHITQFLAEIIDKEELKLNSVKKVVTYHDPCRFGRHSGEFEAPRKILRSIPELDFREMDKNARDSVCCSVGAWVPCNDFSKRQRAGRVREASKTGAETMAVSCPHCYIHFKCVLNDKPEIRDLKNVKMEIEDITSIVLESMEKRG